MINFLRPRGAFSLETILRHQQNDRGFKVARHPRHKGALKQVTQAVLYTGWSRKEDMNEIRVRMRVVKIQNKIVLEIRVKFAMFFFYIYAIIAIEHGLFGRGSQRMLIMHEKTCLIPIISLTFMINFVGTDMWCSSLGIKYSDVAHGIN